VGPEFPALLDRPTYYQVCHEAQVAVTYQLNAHRTTGSLISESSAVVPGDRGGHIGLVRLLPVDCLLAN
jgi:hypothetical protein